MKAMTVGNLKTHFSQVLDEVKNGEDIQVLYGRVKKPIAVLTSYETYNENKQSSGIKKRKLGLYESKASFSEVDDGKITAEEFLGL